MDDQRYPISVRLIGVMHKENDKTYITSVLWSDKNEIVVYRSFADFEKMHKQMKKAFPATNALKKSSRIIPKFKDHRTKGGGQKKGTSRSVLRLKILEKYCEELLSCDPLITQSPDLVRFFHPTAQDLKPEYVSNSIMVMPSDDVTVGDGRQDRAHSMGNVTQPFVMETYRCVASYETKDTKNKPFKVALDETVDVLIKDKAGWWLVENDDKRLAWFPAPYLEKLDEDGDEVDGEDENASPTGIGALYTAVKSYKATEGDEVSVNIGSVVEVLQKSDNGWWLIRSGGKVGYVPTLYLQPYNNPRVRMASLQQDLRGSNLNLSLGDYNPNVRSHSQGNILQVQPPGLGGYNPNDRRHSQGNVLQVQPPGLGGYNPNDRRHSQGNVLQVQPPGLGGYNPNDRRHSQDNVFQVQPPGLGGYNPNDRRHSQDNDLQVKPPGLGGYNPNDRRHSQDNVLQVKPPGQGGYNPNGSRHSQDNVLQVKPPGLGGYNPNDRRHSQDNVLPVQPPGQGGDNPNGRRHSQDNVLQVKPPGLGGYNPNDRRHSQDNVLPVQPPGLGGYNPEVRNHSQGNVLELPATPSQQRLGDQHRCHSLDIPNDPSPVTRRAPPTKSYSDSTSPSSPSSLFSPLPMIKVEEDGGQHLPRGATLESHGSEASLDSDSSEFSFSDDLSSSNGSSTLNLSRSVNEQQLRMSRTPPPATMSSNHLSPTTSKMMPSVSDPNLFKGPTAPKVPPRPRAQEILTRCTTVTRKNASKGGLSPTSTDVPSR